MLWPSCFPSSIKHYRERGKKSLSAAKTQAKNNPFLVNKMSVSFPSQLQHSICSFLWSIYAKCGKAKEVSFWMCVLPRGWVLGPAVWERASLAHPVKPSTSSWLCTSQQPLTMSSSLVHEIAGKEMTQTKKQNNNKPHLQIWAPQWDVSPQSKFSLIPSL